MGIGRGWMTPLTAGKVNHPVRPARGVGAMWRREWGDRWLMCLATAASPRRHQDGRLHHRPAAAQGGAAGGRRGVGVPAAAIWARVAERARVRAVFDEEPARAAPPLPLLRASMASTVD